MSSHSKVTNTNCLILDLGDHSTSNNIKQLVKKNSENQVIELQPNQMKEEDWDQLLGLIIRNNKCITL